jgi:hypothetical protein
MRETLTFDEVKTWLRSAVNDSVSVQITSRAETIAFLDGPIESVMGFESTDSHGLIIDGAGGAWTFDLAEPEFVSATLSTIPDSRTAKQLLIKMRDHWFLIEPGLRGGR